MCGASQRAANRNRRKLPVSSPSPLTHSQDPRPSAEPLKRIFPGRRRSPRPGYEGLPTPAPGSTISIADGRSTVLAEAVPSARLCLDRTWARPEENLAVDEALLHWCEAHPGEEVLRLWESPCPFVVLGYANAAEAEVDLISCAQLGLPVRRRCSGGGAVLQGPGCLSYALILQIERHPQLGHITSTNQWIMETHRALVASLTGWDIRVEGVTDLVVEGAKCSGNSQKRSRSHVLFHGTFLLHLDLALVTQALHHPSREPDYRRGRSHEIFLRQLPLSVSTLSRGLRHCWQAQTEFAMALEPWLHPLLSERYDRESWHRRR